MPGAEGLADVQARLLEMSREQRVDVWGRVDGTPQATGPEWWPWLVAQLDRRIAEVLAGIPSDVAPAVRPGPKPGCAQRPSCAGAGEPPAEVFHVSRTYRLDTGKLHSLPGRGSCPVCGRSSAYSEAKGIVRHGAAADS